MVERLEIGATASWECKSTQIRDPVDDVLPMVGSVNEVLHQVEVVVAVEVSQGPRGPSHGQQLDRRLQWSAVHL